jgi:hypothetical protein
MRFQPIATAITASYPGKAKTLDGRKLEWLAKQPRALAEIARATGNTPETVKAIFCGERRGTTGQIEAALKAGGCPGFLED